MIRTTRLPCFSRSRKPYVQAAPERLQDDHVRRTHVGQLGRTEESNKKKAEIEYNFSQAVFANTLKLSIQKYFSSLIQPKRG